MSILVLTTEKVERARELIDSELMDPGVLKVMVIDEAGNILTECGEDARIIDSTSLAALTAANFGATSQIAKLIGEDDFSLLFHKGEDLSVHFSRLGKELILVSIFDDEVSLGLIRCRISEILEPLNNILES